MKATRGLVGVFHTDNRTRVNSKRQILVTDSAVRIFEIFEYLPSPISYLKRLKKLLF